MKQQRKTFVHSGETYASAIRPLMQHGNSPVIVNIARSPTAAASMTSFVKIMNYFMSMPDLRDSHVAVVMNCVGVVVRAVDGTRVEQGPWDIWWFPGNSDVVFACAVTEPLKDAIVGCVRVERRAT